MLHSKFVKSCHNQQGPVTGVAILFPLSAYCYIGIFTYSQRQSSNCGYFHLNDSLFLKVY